MDSIKRCGVSQWLFSPNRPFGCQTLDPLPSLPLPQEKGSVRKALAEGRPHVGRGGPGARGGPLPHRRRPLQGGPILALLTTTERVSDASVFAVSPENASEERPGVHLSIREGIRGVAFFVASWRCFSLEFLDHPSGRPPGVEHGAVPRPPAAAEG